MSCRIFWAAQRVSALSMATLYVSVPLLAYCMGRVFGVEQRAGRLLGILAIGAAGALTLAWAEAGGQLKTLRLGIGELGFFVGCIASAAYPVLSKWGLNKDLLSERSIVRAWWSLLTGSILIGALGLAWESPHALSAMTFSDGLMLVYLGVFSSGMTFWLYQGATAVLSPGAVTAYVYFVPFVSMLLLFIEQPQRIGWHWLPGILSVMLAISLLLRRDAHMVRNRRLRKSASVRPRYGILWKIGPIVATNKMHNANRHIRSIWKAMRQNFSARSGMWSRSRCRRAGSRPSQKIACGC
jgi:drug/metabolite transporter (DMT)-like permease